MATATRLGTPLTCLTRAVLSTRARLDDGSAAISARSAIAPSSSSSSIDARGGLRCAARFSAIALSCGGRESPWQTC